MDKRKFELGRASAMMIMVEIVKMIKFNTFVLNSSSFYDLIR